MSIKYESKTFKKAGRVTPGQEPETFVANQLTEDSVDVTTPDGFLKDMLSVCGNDWNILREIALDGANTYLRRLAGGSDEATKTAKFIVKMGLGGGKSVTEIAEALRSGAIKF